MLAPAGLGAGRGMVHGLVGAELWTNDLEEAPKAGERRSRDRDGEPCVNMDRSFSQDMCGRSRLRLRLWECKCEVVPRDRHHKWPYFSEMDGLAHPLCLRSPNAMTMSCFACRASSLDFQGGNCKKVTP
jgi:hypothetical protein